MTTMHSESARQWTHIASGLFAFLLRWLSWSQAAALAAVALAFNIVVLPRVGGRRLYRPADHARGFPLGILLYPLAVLLLILVFPARLDIAAAAWAILAFGDGAATLVGRRVGGLHWPWTRDKTVAGTLAFVVFGGLGGIALAWWTRAAGTAPPSVWFIVLAPLGAAISAALVETIPVRLDDNISVPAAAGAVLWLASATTRDALDASWPAIVAELPWGVTINAVTAWGAYTARTVSISGAIAGGLIGTAIYAAGGRAAWILLFATFLITAVATRLGRTRKQLLGIDERRGGRRGASNAIANCGVATIAAIAAVTTPYGDPARLALVAALAAGGSDTVASEIGKAWGRATFLVTSLGRVRPGTPGAMSLEGTAAGLLAAFALASLGIGLGIIPRGMMVAVVGGATIGALVESVLGATLEGPGILNNDMLNFINTAVAAVVVMAVT